MLKKCGTKHKRPYTPSSRTKMRQKETNGDERRKTMESQMERGNKWRKGKERWRKRETRNQKERKIRCGPLLRNCVDSARVSKISLKKWHRKNVWAFGRMSGRTSGRRACRQRRRKKSHLIVVRGSPVWPPRSNVTNDRLRGRSGEALPPPPKFGGSGGQRPPAKNEKI